MDLLVRYHDTEWNKNLVSYLCYFIEDKRTGPFMDYDRYHEPVSELVHGVGHMFVVVIQA